MARNVPKKKNATRKKPAANKVSVKGARLQRDTWRNQFDAWWLHHQASAKDAWQRLLFSPVSTMMTVLVIAIALALPAGLSVLLTNAQMATEDWDGSAHLSVFLKQDTGEETQQELADKWRKRDGIKRVETMTADDALVEFKELSGFGDALDALPDNPLPPLLIVYPKSTKADDLEELSQQLEKASAVDMVQLDVLWVKRLHAMLETVGRIVSVLTLALALAVVLVVVNTIRLGIEARREEIVVVKTVGGTDGFVRRPFLYTGFYYGALGGLCAVLLVQFALFWVGQPVDELILLYESKFKLIGIGWSNAFVIPAFAGILGLLGAWWAVSKHIQDVDPSLL